MKTRKIGGAVAVLGLVAMAACDQDGTGPLTDDLTPDEVQELAVLEDESSFNVALEIAAVSDEIAGPLAVGGLSANLGHNAQARLRFAGCRAGSS